MSSIYFSGGMKLRRSQRLAEVRMITQPGEVVVRSYHLAYKPGAGTGRALLTWVQECAGKTAPCKPETSFAWSSHPSAGVKPGGGVAMGQWTIAAPQPRMVADVNGDGLPDLIVSWDNPAKKSANLQGVSVSLNQGGSFGPWRSWREVYPPHDQPQGTPFDYDQDGRADLLFYDTYYGQSSVDTVNGDLLVLHANPDGSASVLDTGIFLWSQWRLGDVDEGGVAATWEIEGARPEQHGEAVALVDARGRAWLWVTAPAAYGAGGRAVGVHLAARGATVVVSIDTRGEAVLVDPVWTTVAPMNTRRAGHASALLPGGKVLATGGYTPSNAFLSSAEVYDPSLNTWTAVASMSVQRGGHTATALNDGRVLVVCGGNGTTSNATTEIFDPSTGTWSSAGSITARNGGSATLLTSGRVLVNGGEGATDARTTRPRPCGSPTGGCSSPAVTARATSSGRARRSTIPPPTPGPASPIATPSASTAPPRPCSPGSPAGWCSSPAASAETPPPPPCRSWRSTISRPTPGASRPR